MKILQPVWYTTREPVSTAFPEATALEQSQHGFLSEAGTAAPAYLPASLGQWLAKQCTWVPCFKRGFASGVHTVASA